MSAAAHIDRESRAQPSAAPPLSSHWLAALVLAAAFVAPLPHGDKIGGLPSLCVFHNLTGLPCPGCGFTRSLVCCAHGQLGNAIIYHPLGPILFAALAWWSIIGVVSFVKSVTNSQYLRTTIDKPVKPSRLVRFASYAGLILLLAVWVARLAHVLPSPP